VSFMRWLRGGDDDTTATAMMSAGLAEVAGLFQPSRHKQTEHVEELKRLRYDAGASTGVDHELGIAVIRSRPPAAADSTD